MKRNIAHIFAAIGVTALLASCIKEEGSCGPDADGCMLNLSIAAEYITTRAANQPTEPGIPDESFINIAGNDYRVYILDDSGTLLERFEPTLTSLKEADGRYVYELSGKFQPKSDAVRILVLANWGGDFRGAYPDVPSADDPQLMLDQLYKDKDGFNFTYPTQSDDLSWAPSASASSPKGIPMFGLSDRIEIYPQGTSANGSYGIFAPELNIGTIPMLRALAKIEIVNGTPEDNIELRSCSMNWYNTKGRFIPDGNANDKWYEESTQVLMPSLPNGLTTSGSHPLVFVKTGSVIGRERYTAYIPEMDLSTFTTADSDRPMLQIKLGQGTGEQDFEIELTNYGEDGKPAAEQLFDILRNHCYRYTIRSANLYKAEVELTVQVGEWFLGELETEWDYTDHVGVPSGGFLRWDGDYLISKEDETLVIMTPGADRKIDGTFTLSYPMKATWTAVLMPVSGKADAFTITKVDADGTESAATGTLEEIEPITIRIRNTYAQVSEIKNTARLVIVVQTHDNRFMEANICEPGGNFTIVQNVTEIDF